MRTIELDASDWKTALDFISALQKALDAPDWCGSNADAINELMIWGLGAGELPAPYVVHIAGFASTPSEVRDYIALQADCVAKARVEKKALYGTDVDVRITY